MITFDEARAFVLAGCTRNATEFVGLDQALGSVTAQEVVAAEQVPPFANTAVDGYAVLAADTVSVPTTLRVTGTVRAGMSGTDSPVEPGCAVRIMTGAPVPPGADAIVMVEDTEGSPTGDDVVVTATAAAGQHIRPAGDDVNPGDPVIGFGTELTAAHLGVLATIGVTEIEVVRRPRVGVISTGDELVDDGSDLAPGQIRDSNRLTLRKLLESHGFETIDLGLAQDDEGVIEAAMRSGAETCDAIVTTGGVSMGDFDFVKVVLDRIGEMRWMQIAIKPAKPLAFGTIARSDGTTVPVFGLPGNPVSSMVSYELFCRPGLRKMSGFAEDNLDVGVVSGVLDASMNRRPDGKIHFARVVCGWDMATSTYRVRSAGAQGSHQMAAMAAANGLAELPDGPTLEAGATVRVRLLRP
ncbi:MAG: molybdopterin molybdenumtransferase MoeA [Actinobacteria bacterium]|uniref:molybdopterin molybdotransferase n=1 Tax=freshwater metagenome TaxID=449393 RepID=A0A6J6WZF0_9ZZZZ|nr:molybdopterin molybdenumtransferase MoeA [Actinomycetota bacterium]MSZ51623.1 molybdopterin molybdenumtransferase MoeA [Actinomycetota bacterium]